MKLLNGDCLELMQDISDGSIDLILCDLPYQTTNCSWDSIIPFEPLWEQYKRIVKSNGAIVLTASQPFTTKLIASNFDMFKYEWIWDKPQGTGFLNANKQPIRSHENILIFYSNQPTFNPIKTTGHERKVVTKRVVKYTDVYGKQEGVRPYDSTERFPRSIQEFSKDTQRTAALHPTQKPVALMEYLIKTYTNETETVLDNCMGSGTTAIAAINTNRNFIGIEKDETYFKIASDRIETLLKQNELKLDC